MRKVSLSLSGLLLLSLPAFGGSPVLVNQTLAQVGGSGTLTTTGISTTGANFIYVCVGAVGAVNPPTDSLSNTWHQAGSSVEEPGSTTTVAAYYAINPTTGASQTFTESGASYPTMAVSAWSGVATASPLDQVSAGAYTTGATVQPGVLTPAQTNELVLSCVIGETKSADWTINGGFTKINTFIGANLSQQSAYLIEASPAATNPTWTSGTSNATAAVMASFLSAPDYTISGATSGYVSVPSSNITWTKASGNFDGTVTYTVSDGGQGGVWGGSCAGTSTGTATPGSGTTFSCTYTPAVVGSITFTFTNSSTLVNPTPVGFTSQNPAIRIAGCPTSGAKSVQSAAGCTVALNTGLAFSAPVTIIDCTSPAPCTNGTTITPSVGSPCVAPCQVAATGLTSFTFVFTPITYSTLLLSTTNTAGYTNATPASYKVTYTGTTYTLSTSGNVNVAGNWTPSGVPGPGDKVVIPTGFTAAVPNGYTWHVGQCPVGFTAAYPDVDIQSDGTTSGVLQVDAGAVFSPCGNVRLDTTTNTYSGFAVMNVQTGGKVVWDLANGTSIYRLYPAAAVWNKLLIGTAGDLCTMTGGLDTCPTTITSINSGSSQFLLADGSENNDSMFFQVYGAYIGPQCGNASTGCVTVNTAEAASGFSGAFTYDFEGNVWDTTGALQIPNVYNTWKLTLNNNKFKNTTAAYIIGGSGATQFTNTCQVENNYFDVKFGSFSGEYGCYYVADIFTVEYANSGASFSVPEFSYSLWSSSGTTGVVSPGTVDHTYMLSTATSGSTSMHFSENEADIPYAYTFNICENNLATSSEGHCLFDSAATSTPTITHNISLIDVNGQSSGNWMTDNFSGIAGTYKLDHNVVAGTLAVIANAENGYYGTGTIIPEFKYNIGYSPTYNANNLIINMSGATAPANNVSPSGTDYNALWNMATNTIFTVGYNSNCSPSTALNTYYTICTTGSTPGVHDIVANPLFVDTGRNSRQWAATQGQPSTIQGVFNVFLGMPTTSYKQLMANLLSYVSGGYIPENPMLWQGPDGGDIGAVDTPMNQHIPPPPSFSF
ncbi:MAG: hypothetical protein KGL39_16975 [Patescibacteria group bacterium]|nr:hypothetical protein [Patescibacteria group bacterium]